MHVSAHCREMFGMTMTSHQQKHFGTYKIFYEYYCHHYCPRHLVIKYSDSGQEGRKRKPAPILTEWLWPLRNRNKIWSVYHLFMFIRASASLLAKALFQSEHVSQFHRQLGSKTKASSENHVLTVCLKEAPVLHHRRPRVPCCRVPSWAGLFVSTREKIESDLCQRT